MENEALNKLRFIIHRNFCSQYNTGELLNVKDEGKGGTSALIGMSPERLKVYLEEYSEELALPLKIEGHESGAKIAAQSGKDTNTLLKFVAKLPLKGERSDAIRSLAHALSKEDLGVTFSPEAIKLTNEGISVTLEAPGDMDGERLLDDLRRVITPKGFAVDIWK